MSSSSIMTRSSSDEESLSCPSSIARRVVKKKEQVKIDLAGLSGIFVRIETGEKTSRIPTGKPRVGVLLTCQVEGR
jgi:hypothetical protein